MFHKNEDEHADSVNIFLFNLDEKNILQWKDST